MPGRPKLPDTVRKQRIHICIDPAVKKVVDRLHADYGHSKSAITAQMAREGAKIILTRLMAGEPLTPEDKEPET
jgi:hypothetical protein